MGQECFIVDGTGDERAVTALRVVVSESARVGEEPVRCGADDDVDARPGVEHGERPALGFNVGGERFRQRGEIVEL